MATQTKQAAELGTGLRLDGGWQQYWLGFLRLVVGWWFFHSGFTKLLTDGLNYTYGPIYLQGMEGTVLGGLPVWMGNNLAWLIEPGVPIFETLIGLGLMAGVLTRLACAGGAFFMTLFWVGNADFGHGLVNGDLMGLLLFLTLGVLAAGRYYGLDAYIEKLEVVKNHPRLKYLLG